VLRETVSSGRAGGPAGADRLLHYVDVLREELARLHRSLEIFLGHVSPRGDRTGDVDLRELAGELASLLAAPARKERIAVTATLPETPVMATVNPYLLRQVLLHFGLAALAAVPHPGRLEIVLASDGSRARLRIAGGPGGPVVPAASPPASTYPLERLEMARSLLAAEHGAVRECGGRRAEESGGAERSAGAKGADKMGYPEGDSGFEIELPLAKPEVSHDAARARR
jgi:hypothetical protein